MQKQLDPRDMQNAVPLDAGTATPRPRASVLRGIAQAGLMLAVLAAGVIGMNRLIASAPERAARPFTPPVITVEAVDAVAGTHVPKIAAFGEIVAARTVDLRPAVAGEILTVSPNLRAGDRVQEGEILASIDRFEYEGALVEARANLAQTEAAIVEIEARIAAERDQLATAEDQLRLAADDVARAEGLRRNGSLTERQLDERRLILSQRDSALTQRRNNMAIETARLEQQRAQADRLAWKLRQAEQALANTEIRAPFAGIISAASVETGKRVGAQDVIASLFAPDTLDIRFAVTDAQFGRLLTDSAPLVGRPVEAMWDVGGTRYTMAARITRLGAQVASASGGAELFARIDSASLAPEIRDALRPGAFVSVSLPGKTLENTVRLPETALHGAFVHAVEDGVLVPVAAQLLAYDGADAILAADGVAGRTIMTTRLAAVDPGTKVQIAGREPPPSAGAEPVRPAAGQP
ncbi:MAG: HlyD family efflux transporter periplasmic adaptor subunit [Rhizobiaceae bacterium]|nr:HlyD family efflux transporter periplasmic adaptor subunit [Rhizobiaceae bacterium]